MPLDGAVGMIVVGSVRDQSLWAPGVLEGNMADAAQVITEGTDDLSADEDLFPPVSCGER